MNTKRIKVVIIGLAVLIGAVGFYYYYSNIWSKAEVKVEILSQETSVLLEEVVYIVKYKNNSDAVLEEPELIFDFPEDSIPINEDSLKVFKEAKDFNQEGAIYPGQEGTFEFRARLLGEEKEFKTAKVVLSYRPKNLKPRYESSNEFTVRIEEVPLNFSLDLPLNAEPGKDLRIKLNYYNRSQIDYPIPNLRVSVNYPDNFEFISSSPKSLEKTEWDVGSLNNGDGGRIEIVRKMNAESGDEGNFEAKIESWKDGTPILLKKITKTMLVTSTSLNVDQYINGRADYVASPGERLYYEVVFRNRGETPLTDLYIESRLEGEAFDFTNVSPMIGAEFEWGSRSIIFDWRKISDLQFLDAGEEKKVTFSIDIKEGWDFSPQARNPVVKNIIYISRQGQKFVTDEIIAKVNSKLEIIQRGVFEDEIFGNSGPLPPVVGQPTTYTITWLAKNYYSEVRNAKVRAVLPSYVTIGQIFPEEEVGKLTFDSVSRELVWDVGDLPIGAGIEEGVAAPNISFQITFIPTASQRGQTPVLIGEAVFRGHDQWTDKITGASTSLVDTTLPDDPSMDIIKATVQ